MRLVCVLLLASCLGCQREDGDRLARVGRKVTEKVRDAVPTKTPLGDLNPEATPAGRVRARFRLDRQLADVQIQVEESPAGITLRGTVATQELADWAVQLAQKTDGVTAVVNEITVGS